MARALGAAAGALAGDDARRRTRANSCRASCATPSTRRTISRPRRAAAGRRCARARAAAGARRGRRADEPRRSPRSTRCSSAWLRCRRCSAMPARSNAPPTKCRGSTASSRGRARASPRRRPTTKTCRLRATKTSTARRADLQRRPAGAPCPQGSGIDRGAHAASPHRRARAGPDAVARPRAQGLTAADAAQAEPWLPRRIAVASPASLCARRWNLRAVRNLAGVRLSDTAQAKVHPKMLESLPLTAAGCPRFPLETRAAIVVRRKRCGDAREAHHGRESLAARCGGQLACRPRDAGDPGNQQAPRSS